MRCLISCVAAALCLSRVCQASLYDSDSHVFLLDDASTFQSEVAQDDGIWLVQFFSPSDPQSQQLVQQYNIVAEICRGVFNIAAVDISTEAGQQIGASYQVDSFPTLYIFGDDDKPKMYNGAYEAQQILQVVVDTAINTLRTRAGGPRSESTSSRENDTSRGATSEVVELTSSNFQQEVLDNPMVSAVAFAAPWCGYCKKLRPEWEQAARKLQGEGAILGWVDATSETDLAQIYGVQGYPTIKLYPGGSGKSHGDAMDYEGGRTAAEIVQGILAEVDRTGVPKEIPELTSGAVLKENCDGHNHICVIAALPHILDSGVNGRKAYKDVIAKVSKMFRGSAFSFLWFEGTSQPDLERSLELSFGFPAVAAFSMDKEAYVVMRSSFTEKSIAAFLHGVTSGRQRTVKVDVMPKVLTVEPWDGKDGAPVEEEMPLCEVMGNCDESQDEL